MCHYLFHRIFPQRPPVSCLNAEVTRELVGGGISRANLRLSLTTAHRDQPKRWGSCGASIAPTSGCHARVLLPRRNRGCVPNNNLRLLLGPTFRYTPLSRLAQHIRSTGRLYESPRVSPKADPELTCAGPFHSPRATIHRSNINPTIILKHCT